MGTLLFPSCSLLNCVNVYEKVSINRLNVGILAVAGGLKHVKDINLNLLRPRVLIWGCCILAFLLIILYSAKYFTLFLFCFMLYNEPTVPIFLKV